jgi:hypothetical protein
MQRSVTGKKSPGIVIQERDRQLLHDLSIMRIIDRGQAARVAGFNSVTRANTRLLALVRAGLLKRVFLGTTFGGAKALYMLSPKAARFFGLPNRSPRRGSEELIVTDTFVPHQLAINEIYCSVKCNQPRKSARFVRWEVFTQPVAPGVQLIPDGYFEVEDGGNVLVAFLEVDLGHEGLALWKTKAQRYLDYAISGQFQRRFSQQRFRVLVVTDSVRRLNNIRNVVNKATDKIFWFSTFELVNREGFWSPVWLRPREDGQRPLL